jgi:hypothetical protein
MSPREKKELLDSFSESLPYELLGVLNCCAIAGMGRLPKDGKILHLETVLSEEVVKNEIVKRVKSLISLAKRDGCSAAMVTLNTEQTKCAEIFEELGFVSSTPHWMYRKSSHFVKTGVKVFVKELCPKRKSAKVKEVV